MEFSFIQLSSQTSDGASGTTKLTRAKRYINKKTGSYNKGQKQPPRASSISESPLLKRHKIERPSSELFSDIRFTAPLGSYPFKLDSGDKTGVSELVVPTGNAICNLEILSLVFGQLNCTDRSCYGRLKLYEIPLDDGLQNFLLVNCTNCHKLVAEFPASPPIGVSAIASINDKSMITKGKSEINQRALMAVHTTSFSWEEFRLTCSLLDVKPPGRNMSHTQLTKFMKASLDVANESMKIAGKQAYDVATPVIASDSGLRDCPVSFDASWHRRGHYSNQGFSAAINTESGRVQDYALYDRVCFPCSKWPETRRSSNPEEFQDYWARHKNSCPANYSGTSQSMESSGAVVVWRRSIQTHNLVYGTYVGDGDSSSFQNLIESDPYEGIVPIRKKECTGHVQKRLKKRLMKKGKGFTSLSQGKAERIAHLYALVIVQNRGKSASEIHDGLQVLMAHTKEEDHRCPPGETSWCYYQKRLAKYDIDAGAAPPTTREPYLTPGEYARAVDVFTVFGSLSFCSTITMGKTQNANESLHNMLWHNSPKFKTRRAEVPLRQHRTCCPILQRWIFGLLQSIAPVRHRFKKPYSSLSLEA